MAVRNDRGAREPGAAPEARVRQLIDQDEIAGADKRRKDSEVREISRPEDAGGLRVLEPRQALLQLGIERMVSRDEARASGTRPIEAQRLACGLDHGRMMRQIEIIVAAKGQEPPAITQRPDAGHPDGL